MTARRSRRRSARPAPRARVLDDGSVVVPPELTERVGRSMMVAFDALRRQSSGGWRPDDDLVDVAAILQRAHRTER